MDIGGSDSMHAIKRAIDAIMTKEVQKQISFSGKRTVKPGLATDYKYILDAIHDAMQEKFTCYRRIDGERKLGSLLRSV